MNKKNISFSSFGNFQMVVPLSSCCLPAIVCLSGRPTNSKCYFFKSLALRCVFGWLLCRDCQLHYLYLSDQLIVALNMPCIGCRATSWLWNISLSFDLSICRCISLSLFYLVTLLLIVPSVYVTLAVMPRGLSWLWNLSAPFSVRLSIFTICLFILAAVP